MSGTISSLVLILLLLAAVAAIGAASLAIFVLRRMQALRLEMDARLAAGHPPCQLVLSAREGLNGLSAQVRDLPQPVASGPSPSVLRIGLNLNKRSQVIRLHRRGDSPTQIAAALEVPRQEVDLLLKVHRIVVDKF